MSIPKIIFNPRVITHSVNPPSGIIEHDVEGGLPKSRADILHGYSSLPVSWVCENKEKFEYLMAMYNSKLKEGALPFLLYIPVLSTECAWHECKFVKNSFKHVSTDGPLRTINAKVKVVAKRDAEADEYLTDVINATGSFDEADHLSFVSLFDALVNVHMPFYLGDL